MFVFVALTPHTWSPLYSDYTQFLSFCDLTVYKAEMTISENKFQKNVEITIDSKLYYYRPVKMIVSHKYNMKYTSNKTNTVI